MGRAATFDAYEWRGPFWVKRAGRGWKIVNRYGDEERLGYRYKGAADEECRLMNLAQAFTGPKKEKEQQ